MKNWLPFVFGPLFAIDSIPLALCCHNNKECGSGGKSIQNQIGPKRLTQQVCDKLAKTHCCELRESYKLGKT